jgi:hypothetical protein
MEANIGDNFSDNLVKIWPVMSGVKRDRGAIPDPGATGAAIHRDGGLAQH